MTVINYLKAIFKHLYYILADGSEYLKWYEEIIRDYWR